MTKLNDHLIAKTFPLAHKENMIVKEGYRITILTPSLARLEVQEDGKFNDQATQVFWNRNLPVVDYKISEDLASLQVTTSKVTFYYDKNAKTITKVLLNNKWVACDNKNNLGGTCRTLDFRIGAVGIGNGLLSRDGVSVYEDDSLLLVEGKTVSKLDKSSDKYIFAYGNNYRECLKDFFAISGKVPMLPKYVLGNWWSRYKAYSQEEYIALMERFEKENIPLTVATIDMDWHWVDVNKRFNTNYKINHFVYAPGWTGYSWNTELFPDYRAFLRWLGDHNYAITVNLHPAEGIRSFEDCYEAMAKGMGIDPKSKQDIPFDLSDNNFINNYFDAVHRPYEKEGVDFWWIDWQQGKKSTVADLDPLWALNHYHFLDKSADNKRGVILSRYSGLGSHRYPLGFSGDTFVYWKNLKFQPYFTSTAGNVGYGWWSHDIGGHQLGVSSDEMYLRWLQFGVFSPINRLHSTSHDLLGKEPWYRSAPIKELASKFLRLRHALIPYIYTMNYLSHVEGRALCEPMYYSYPDNDLSYTVPNQYTFGTELIVSPIVRPSDKSINMAKAEVWLPEGRHTDIFTGKIYQGGKKYTMFRDIDAVPALAKEGAIIPLAYTSDNSIANPVNLELLIYRGNNSFTLYEDDGVSYDFEQGKFVQTKFSITEDNGTVTFAIAPVVGESSLVPAVRTYTLCFKDIIKGDLTIEGEKGTFAEKITVDIVSAKGATITVTNCQYLTNGDAIANAKQILSRGNGSNIRRMLNYMGMHKITDSNIFYNKIKRSCFSKNMKLAVKEAMDK